VSDAGGASPASERHDQAGGWPDRSDEMAAALDRYLHEADGTHRMHAPNMHGREIAAWGQAMDEHLADGHTHEPDEQPQPLLIAGEPDALKRAQNCLLHVAELGGALDRLPEREQQFARIDGRQRAIARQQAVHVELASASAQVAIAEELRALRALLDERLRRP
jgi:hypothetical protein